jgi:hypothetical protein
MKEGAEAGASGPARGRIVGDRHQGQAVNYGDGRCLIYEEQQPDGCVKKRKANLSID